MSQRGRGGPAEAVSLAAAGRGQQGAAEGGPARGGGRWRAAAGRDFKSPSFPPNPSFSSPPPGRRGGSFHRPPRALARPCSASRDRQQPASKSLIISLFFLLLPFPWKQKKSEAGASAAPGLLGPWAWRGRPRGPGRAARLLERPWARGCAGGAGAARSEPAWRGGAGGWRPHGARPHLPPGLGSMK